MKRLFLAVLALGCCWNTLSAQDLSGQVKVDGSSTVYLITEAMASEFKKLHPNVNITVGISGSGGGFKKFAAGETDLSDASRAIKESEAKACAANGIEFHEFQVALDGLTVVINPENDWAKKMTVEQLKKIWHPDSAAKNWSDVDPSWPNEPIKLFGPGPDSGTFDYFTKAINGKEKLSRTDYEASEDDNVIVRGVSGNKFAMGYFGLAYYEENKEKLGAVAVGADGKFVSPSIETVLDGSYKPLSRPLFVYVKKSSLKRPEIQEFMTFYLRRYDLVSKSGYIKMSTKNRYKAQQKLKSAIRLAQ